MNARPLRLILLWVLLAAFVLTAPASQALSGTEVAVLRLGKADAIFILTAEHAILIDAGEAEDAVEILAFLQKRQIPALDAMIITHYDKDHVGGAAAVLDGITVRAVYDAAYESSRAHYDLYLEAIARQDVPRHRVAKTQALALGSLTLTLLPSAQADADDNNQSLVVSMDDGLHTFLFAADAEEARIDELLAEGLAHHDVLKMPHHGRRKDNLAELLAAVSPDIAVITDSSKNPADDETLALLEAAGIQTYRTMDGDIHILSGKGGLTISQ